MDNQALYQFYQFAVLPQFGFSKGGSFTWRKSVNIGPDETAHYFSHSYDQDASNYVLVYEDYQGLGCNDEFIRDTIELEGRDFKYIDPTSASTISPSYKLSLPVPYKGANNVFGSFTLINLK